MKQGNEGVPIAEICGKTGISQALDREMFSRCHPPKAPRFARKRKLMHEMLVDWIYRSDRPCKVLSFDTSTYHYKFLRAGQIPLERRLREICETRVRNGYRRVHVQLCHDGL